MSSRTQSYSGTTDDGELWQPKVPAAPPYHAPNWKGQGTGDITGRIVCIVASWSQCRNHLGYRQLMEPYNGRRRVQSLLSRIAATIRATNLAE